MIKEFLVLTESELKDKLHSERLKWNKEMMEKLQKLSIVKSYKFPPEQNKKIDEFMASLDQLLEQLEKKK